MGSFRPRSLEENVYNECHSLTPQTPQKKSCSSHVCLSQKSRIYGFNPTTQITPSPLSPLHSLLETISQTWSITASSFTSMDKTKGEETMDQALKCERASKKLKPRRLLRRAPASSIRFGRRDPKGPTVEAFRPTRVEGGTAAEHSTEPFHRPFYPFLVFQFRCYVWGSWPPWQPT